MEPSPQPSPVVFGMPQNISSALKGPILDGVSAAANIVTASVGLYDRFVPEKRPDQTALIREELANMATRQSNDAALQTAAIQQLADASSARAALQTAAIQQLADASSARARVLETLSNDLAKFAKPDVLGQLMNAGALLTSGAAVAHIKRLADAAEKMSVSLNRMADNVSSENSRGEKFPQHVHSFVRSMTRKHRDEKVPHYFFVFNPGTAWHPMFDKCKEQDPLGATFLGYSHDLDQLVASIVEVARPKLGPKPVMHILIPTIAPLAITESLTFPQEAGPIHVTGQLNEDGVPFVYLCMPLDADRRNLHNIGSLQPKRRWVLYQKVGVCLPFLHRWLATEIEPIFFEDPSFTVHTTSALLIYDSCYTETTPVPPRALGAAR